MVGDFLKLIIKMNSALLLPPPPKKETKPMPVVNTIVREIVKSPCKGICNSSKGPFCTGCGRTHQEVIKWHKFFPEEAKTVLRIAKLRLKKAEQAL